MMTQFLGDRWEERERERERRDDTAKRFPKLFIIQINLRYSIYRNSYSTLTKAEVKHNLQLPPS